MSKKPSLTKQIADTLGTDNKQDQLKLIRQMVQTMQVPAAAVTVMISRGKVSLNVLSVAKLTPEDAKYILQKGIDEITSQIVRSELERAQSGEGNGPSDIDIPGDVAPVEDVD